jgi:Domain of unknown function (DUF4340)
VSKRFVLVLAVLVAALGGYVVLFERGSLTSKQLEERKSKVLRSFLRDHVLRLTLTRSGVKLVLERARESDGTLSLWRLTAPLAGAADQDAVDRLLGELEWLSPRRVLENVGDADRAQLGLDKPRFRFGYRIDDQDYEAEVGGRDVQGDNHYLALGGERTVYVVPKTLVEALDYDVGHFRAKEFLGDITSAWAARLKLTRGAEQLSLHKEGERWWVLNEPKSLADEQRVRQLVAALDGLRALRFVERAGQAEALADLARASERIELDVVPDTHREDKAAQRFVLRLGGPCKGHAGERYAQAGDKGDPVCVREEEIAQLLPPLPELRLTRLLGVEVSEIERIELAAGPTKWVFKREGEKWLGEGGPAPDREAVEAWLRDLSTLRANELLPKIDKPTGTRLELVLASRQKLGLTAEANAAGEVRVQRDGDGVALRFGPALADQLAQFGRRFAGLGLWPALQPSQVTGVSAQDGVRARTLSVVEGSFRVRGKGAEPDPQRTRELVRDAIKLTAISIVAERARAEHGIEGSGRALTLELGQGKSVSLELGADATAPAGVYARVDRAYVVVLGAEAKGLLAELAGGERVLPEAGVGEGEGEEEGEGESDHDHDHGDDHGHD